MSYPDGAPLRQHGLDSCVEDAVLTVNSGSLIEPVDDRDNP